MVAGGLTPDPPRSIQEGPAEEAPPPTAEVRSEAVGVAAGRKGAEEEAPPPKAKAVRLEAMRVVPDRRGAAQPPREGAASVRPGAAAAETGQAR